jgi:hypothetical protein
MVATTPIPADRHTVKAASTALDSALAEPPAKPEPATDEQVTEADESHEPSWLDYRDGWRAAERWHGIPPLCAAIDAAMDAPATPAAAVVDASTAPAMQCAYPHCCDKAGNRCPRMFAGQCSGPRAADPQQVGR